MSNRLHARSSAVSAPDLARNAAPIRAPAAPVLAAAAAVPGSLPLLLAPSGGAERQERHRREVQMLIETLAPMLGLSAAQVEVRMDGSVAARLDARGADAMMERGVVLLHPSRFDPDTERGRYLVAHEAVHLAQRSPSAAADHAPAEREAHAMARDFAAGHGLEPPRAALPSHASAADVDAAIFDANDAARRGGELAQIRNWLGGLWISDGDVDKILTLLSSLPMAAAIALVRALLPGERHDLLNNINSHHYKPFRRQVLIVYTAVPAAEIRASFDEGLLTGIDMFGLDLAEVFGIDHVAEALTPDRRRKLGASKVGRAVADVQKRAHDPAALQQRDEDYAASIEEETKEQDALGQRRKAAKAALANQATGPALQAAIKRVRELLSRFWIRDADALLALDTLQPYAADPGALQAIVDGLVVTTQNPDRYEEKKNFLDVLIDQIPVERLYDRASPRLPVLVRLMSFRPAWKNIDVARKVLNRWFANSEDAFLAFALVKALPEREQAAFIDNAGDAWSSILSGMSLSQRESLPVNLYGGGKDQADRNAILVQLMDDAAWKNPQRLSGLIRMAIAADHYTWVFAESQRRVSADPLLLNDDNVREAIDKYGLYNPRVDARWPDGSRHPRLSFQQDAYKPASYRGKSWTQEGVLGVLGKIFGGLDAFHKSKLSLTRPQPKAIALSGINLAEVQDATGGDLAGATLDRQADLGMVGAEAIRTGKGVNIIDSLRWNYGQAGIAFRMEDVSLASLHLPLGVMKIQAGNGTVRNVDFELRYPTKDPASPLAISLYVGEIDLEDVTIIRPGEMYGAEEARLQRLYAQTTTSGTETSRGVEPQDAMLPLAFSMLGDMIRAAGQVRSDEIKRPSRPMALDVTFAAVRLKGVTTSAGQFASNVTLTDFTVRGGGDEAAYREALRLSGMRMETRIAMERKAMAAGVSGDHERTIRQLEKQRDGVTRELAAFGEADGLRAKRRQHEANPNQPPLTETESTTLADLERRATRLVLDVGSFTAEGITGLPVTSLKAENLHGQGRTIGGLIGTATVVQFLEGASTLANLPQKGAGFSLDIGSLETSEINIAGSVPTPDEAAADVRKFERRFNVGEPGALDQLKALRLRSTLAGEYAGLLARGVQTLSPTEQATLRAKRGELEAIEAQRLTHVGRLAIEGTRIGVGETGTLSLQADTLVADDLVGYGGSATRLSATALSVSADVKDGVFGVSKWRENFRSGSLQAGTFDLSDIRYAGSGVVVRSLKLDEASAGFTKGGAATFKADGIVLANVIVSTSRKLLLAERELLLAVPLHASRERDMVRVKAIDVALDALGEIDRRAEKAAVARDVAQQKGNKAAVAAADKALADAERDRLAWQEQLVLRGLDLRGLDLVVEGLGDVLAPNFDIDKALKTGITLRSGASGRMAAGATLDGAQGAGMTAGKVTFGPLGGTVVLKDRSVTLTGLFLDSLSLAGLDYNGGGTRLWSGGATTLSGIKLSANVEYRDVVDKTGFKDREISRIVIGPMQVARLAAQKFGYSSRELGISVDVASGAALNISAENLTIERPAVDPKTRLRDKTTITGKAGIGALDQIRLSGVIGQSLAAHGVLTGSDLRVELLEAGETIHVGDLSLVDGSVRDPAKGNARLSISHLSGDVAHHVTAAGDWFDLRHIKLGAFRIEKGMTWADGGKSLVIDGGAAIVNLRANAMIRRRLAGKEYVVEQITVPELSVERIEAARANVAVAATPADPAHGVKAAPEKALSVEQATINNLSIVGFDLLQGLGTLKVESQDINDLGVRIAKRGEEAFKQGHLSLKGTGLTGTLAGKDKILVDLGKIASLSGSYEDSKTSVGSFGVADITGKAEIGPDYVQIMDLDTGPIMLGHTVYDDKAGKKVTLDGAQAKALHLVKLRAGFTTPKAGEEAKLAAITVDELRFDQLVADQFTYNGLATTKNKDNQDEASQTEIKARKALFAPLHVEKLNLDLLKDVTSIKADIGEVSILGFAGTFRKSVAGELKRTTTVNGDLTGGELRADLTFASAKLASGQDFTQTSGTFHLGRLGLSAPDVAITDFAGGKEASRIAIGNIAAQKAGLNLTGLDVSLAPNGTLLLKLEDVIAHNLAVTLTKTGKRIDVRLPFAEIKSIALGLVSNKTGDGMKALAAQLGEIRASGLSVKVHVVRQPTSAEPDAPGEDFAIEPLAGAQGTITVSGVLGKELFVDAIIMPIENGEIDLTKLQLIPEKGVTDKQDDAAEEKGETRHRHLEVGSNSLLFWGYLDLPFTERKLPVPLIVPTTEGRGGLLKDKGRWGSIALRPFVESYLNERSEPGKPGTPPSDLSKLDYLGLRESNFQLGAGRIGTPTYGITLAAGVPGANLVNLVRSVVGQNVALDINPVHASALDFGVADEETGKVTRGTSGPVDFAKVHVSIEGLAGSATAGFDINITTESGTIQGVSFGDVALLTTAAMTAQPGPALKETAK